MTVLAIIPARGGSKGIPRKNLVPLAGRPLIAYTLDAAREAKRVTDIMVSTDDEEIAAFCEMEGVLVPYRRPQELASDTAGMVETVLHAIDSWSAKHGKEPDLVALLQPTSPLRNADDIDGTIAAASLSESGSAISVHVMAEHPMECVRATGGSWEMLVRPPQGVVRRQDYGETFYFINGAVYAVMPAFLRARHAFTAEGRETALHVMNGVRGIDIDEQDDLDMVEAVLSHRGLCARHHIRTTVHG